MSGKAGQIEVGGKVYDVVEVDQMTFDELDLAMAISRGLTPPELARGMMLWDPRAWRAVAVVSARRVDPEFSPEALGDVVLKDFVDKADATAEAEEEGDDARPPDGDTSIQEGSGAQS